MKKTSQHLKRIALLLIFLMTLQSCSIYYSKTASIDEAIQSDNKVKVITSTNDTYKFVKIQRENDQIYGVVKKGNKTAETLSDLGLIKNSDEKTVTIFLEDITVKELYLKNKGASTAVTVAIPVVVVGVLVGIGVHSANNFSLNWTGE